MKKLVTLDNGNTLLEVPAAELSSLEWLAKLLVNLFSAPSAPPSEIAPNPTPRSLTSKKVKPRAQIAARKQPAGSPSATRNCEDCGNPFEPWRKDQRFCSACAKKSHHVTSKPKPSIESARKPGKCVICGKPIPADSHPTKKTCFDECTKEKDRRYAKRHYRELHPVTGGKASTPPHTPTLPHSHTSTHSAARLAAIRQAAANLRERDPLADAAAAANEDNDQ